MCNVQVEYRFVLKVSILFAEDECFKPFHCSKISSCPTRFPSLAAVVALIPILITCTCLDSAKIDEVVLSRASKVLPAHALVNMGHHSAERLPEDDTITTGPSLLCTIPHMSSFSHHFIQRLIRCISPVIRIHKVCSVFGECIDQNSIEINPS